MTNHLYIYNTLTRDKKRFEPKHAPQVGLYVCGMTVYDLCHLGHARVLIFFDVVRRYLEFLGYKVNYVRNITDIDDKIIQRAHKNEENVNDLTARFIEEMHRDCDYLNVTAPSDEPRATHHIPHMITMIEQLMQKGYAYIDQSGDVCFRVEKFNHYGQLSHQDIDKLQAGTRASILDTKENPLDFVLWKLAKPGEPSWNSPWGLGRPGWHIECSAMSTHCLGTHFDIHGGGLDLIFPHHENEIAQSEAATDEKFVDTWMHVGHLRINDGEKMSKSLGNFFTVREILEKYHGEVIRYFMLTSHYRSPINYATEYLDQAHAALLSCYTALLHLPTATIEANFAHEIREKFQEKMNNDFNTPEALAILFEVVREINRLKERNDTAMAANYGALLRELGGILGILQQPAEAFWKNLHAQHSDDISTIEHLIAERNQARKDKNWQKADEIRNKLSAMHIVLEDVAEGTQWRKV